MITGEVRGLEATISGIRNFEPRVKAIAWLAVVHGLKALQTASLKEITATDHSLVVLKAMGHPYATRNPRPPHAEPVIHIQSGRYVAGLRVYPPAGLPGAIVGGEIRMDGDSWVQQLDAMLQQGTSRMIARPWMKFITQTIGPAVVAAVKAEIANAIRESGIGA
jgi:hypothetical protein